jgi:peroxiredoxin Q/BCP
MRDTWTALLLCATLGACGSSGTAPATAAATPTEPTTTPSTPAGDQTMAMETQKPGLLKVGDKAPDFTLEDQDGKTVTLADFKGQRVLMWFYPKADTPGCTAEGKGFRDRFEKVKGKATIVGVSVDEPAANKAFATKYEFPFKLLSDPSRTMCVAYGACADTSAKYAERITYVIDANGRIETAEKVKDIASHVDSAVNQACSLKGH